MFFEEVSPLSRVPALRGINPSLDVSAALASHDEKNRRRSPRAVTPAAAPQCTALEVMTVSLAAGVAAVFFRRLCVVGFSFSAGAWVW